MKKGGTKGEVKRGEVVGEQQGLKGKEGGKKREKGWEERGPKAHSKTLILVPLRFRYSLVAFHGVGKQGYGNRAPIDDGNPIRKFSIDCLDASEINGTTRPQLTRHGRELKTKADREIQYRPRTVDTDIDCGPRFCGPHFGTASETPREGSGKGSGEGVLRRVLRRGPAMGFTVKRF